MSDNVLPGAARYAGTAYTFSELSAMLPEQRNAVLAEAIHDLDILMQPLKDARANAVRWLESYAFEQGESATVIPAGDFEVKIERDVRWLYDVDEGLAQLTAFGVSQDEFDDAVQRTWKVNKAKLNKLAKRGGRIASIIEQNCHKTVTGLKLTVRRASRSDSSSGPSFVSEFVPAGKDD